MAKKPTNPNRPKPKPMLIKEGATGPKRPRPQSPSTPPKSD